MVRSGKEKDASGVYRLSYSLLAVLLLLTVGVTFAFYKNAAEKDAVKFNATSNRLQTEIQNKINLYITLLAGVRGFISTTPNLNRNDFAGYVESLHLQSNYPALLRVGYIKRVNPDGLDVYRQEMARAGYPELKIDAPAGTATYDLLSFVEPQTEATKKAIGFDAASDPERRAAMTLAANSKAAAMSAPLKPIVEAQPVSPVIAIYLPVYKEGDAVPNDDTSGRTTAGFVYTSFTPDAFLADIEKVQVDKDVAIQIYDGGDTRANLLAATASVKPDISGLFSEKQTLRSELPVAGRTWVTRFTSLPAFSQHSAVGWTPMLFIAGTCFSFLVFGFTYHDASRRSELQKLADELLVTQSEKERLFEKEQQARVEAEDANKAKDEFLAIVSHELKTPLNTIAGWTTILRSDQLSPGTKDTALRKIEKNLRLQAKMVEQILNFSQLMSDNAVVSFAPVLATEVFKGAIRSVEDAASEKTIVFKSVNELNGELVDADAEKLKLALVNVLANAVKFTLPGGNIEARATVHDGEVQFAVKDNGSGIDPSFLPHVFEQYRQADKPAVRSYGGLGLGLAITKHIIEMHGGHVETASAGIGHGSEFTLSVPIKSTKPDV